MGDAKRWGDLSPRQQVGGVISAVVQLVLAAAAWTDLAKRPADEIRGPKPMWAVLILINFVGPISYFAFGRRRD
jgi:hypothetical protein